MLNNSNEAVGANGRVNLYSDSVLSSAPEFLDFEVLLEPLEDNQVSHALAITQLSKHQRKELVPTCEVLHVFVAGILANKIIEVIPVEKRYQLSENVLVLIHM